jgi:hypothetical protein
MQSLVEAVALLGNTHQLPQLTLQSLVARADFPNHCGADICGWLAGTLPFQFYGTVAIRRDRQDNDWRRPIDLADCRHIGYEGVVSVTDSIGNQVRSQLVGFQPHDQLLALPDLDGQPL